MAFHRQHPEVWKLFERFAFEAIAVEHRDKWGVGAVWERMRWETRVNRTAYPQTFKLNNNYRAFYARAFARKHPEHAEFFRTREQKSQDEPATGLPALTPDDFDQ